MASIQKLFLKRIKEAWRDEFPFLRAVDLVEIPRMPKGCNFLCDGYFAERGRAYFVTFDFSLRRIGEFTLSVSVSDSLTRSIYGPTLRSPSPFEIGSFSIGQFIGVQRRTWALVDVNAQVDAFFTSLEQRPVGFAQMRSQYTWYPSSFELPQTEIFDAALSDVCSVLREHVFPKLRIEYETQKA